MKVGGTGRRPRVWQGMAWEGGGEVGDNTHLCLWLEGFARWRNDIAHIVKFLLSAGGGVGARLLL